MRPATAITTMTASTLAATARLDQRPSPGRDLPAGGKGTLLHSVDRVRAGRPACPKAPPRRRCSTDRTVCLRSWQLSVWGAGERRESLASLSLSVYRAAERQRLN